MGFLKLLFQFISFSFFSIIWVRTYWVSLNYKGLIHIKGLARGLDSSRNCTKMASKYDRNKGYKPNENTEVWVYIVSWCLHSSLIVVIGSQLEWWTHQEGEAQKLDFVVFGIFRLVTKEKRILASFTYYQIGVTIRGHSFLRYLSL